jgi:hypothetical protein
MQLHSRAALWVEPSSSHSTLAIVLTRVHTYHNSPIITLTSSINPQLWTVYPPTTTAQTIPTKSSSDLSLSLSNRQPFKLSNHCPPTHSLYYTLLKRTSVRWTHPFPTTTLLCISEQTIFLSSIILTIALTETIPLHTLYDLPCPCKCI